MSRAFWRQVWSMIVTRVHPAYRGIDRRFKRRTCTRCGQEIVPKYVHVYGSDHPPVVGPVRRWD